MGKIEIFYTFGESIASRIVNFLDRGFSKKAINLFLIIFLDYRRRDLPMDALFKAFEHEWETVWKCQDVSFRGDIQAPGEYSTQNLQAFLRFTLLYEELIKDQPLNFISSLNLITMGKMTIHTDNLRFRFGNVTYDGFRSIYCRAIKLPFSVCIAVSIQLGGVMQLAYRERNKFCFFQPIGIIRSVTHEP